MYCIPLEIFIYFNTIFVVRKVDFNSKMVWKNLLLEGKVFYRIGKIGRWELIRDEV